MRERDATCPYCGSENRAPVPSPNLGSRAVLLFGAVSTLAAVEACTSVALYGAPGDPYVDYDAAPPPRNDGSTGEPPGPVFPDSGAACFQNLGERVNGTEPSRGRGLCSAIDVSEVEARCIASPHGSEGCTAWKASHADCARCIFGPAPGEGPAPVGALIPSGPSTYMTNLGACASIVLGRLDCAVPIAKASSCTAGSCTTCRSEQRRSCESFADTACVGPKEGACNEALQDGYATWASTCQGATPGATFAKVATFLCGAGPADASTDQ